MKIEEPELTDMHPNNSLGKQVVDNVGVVTRALDIGSSVFADELETISKVSGQEILEEALFEKHVWEAYLRRRDKASKIQPKWLTYMLAKSDVKKIYKEAGLDRTFAFPKLYELTSVYVEPVLLEKLEIEKRALEMANEETSAVEETPDEVISAGTVEISETDDENLTEPVGDLEEVETVSADEPSEDPEAAEDILAEDPIEQDSLNEENDDAESEVDETDNLEPSDEVSDEVSIETVTDDADSAEETAEEDVEEAELESATVVDDEPALSDENEDTDTESEAEQNSVQDEEPEGESDETVANADESDGTVDEDAQDETAREDNVESDETENDDATDVAVETAEDATSDSVEDIEEDVDEEPVDEFMAGLIEPPDEGFVYEDDADVDPETNARLWEAEELGEEIIGTTGQSMVVDRLVVQHQVTEHSNIGEMTGGMVAPAAPVSPIQPVAPVAPMQQPVQPIQPISMPQRPALPVYLPRTEQAAAPTEVPSAPVPAAESEAATVPVTEPEATAPAPVQQAAPPPAATPQQIHADMEVLADSVNITNKGAVNPLADFDPSRYLNLARTMAEDDLENSFAAEDEGEESPPEAERVEASENPYILEDDMSGDGENDTVKVNQMLKELRQLRGGGLF